MLPQSIMFTIYSVHLICLSCVNGLFSVNVAQEKHEAEENANVTLEWIFTALSSLSLDSLHVYCSFLSPREEKTVLEISKGVELHYSHQDFSGRVSCDRDRLRQGRLLLCLSNLCKDDSGTYKCDIRTPYGTSGRTCDLNVTEAYQPFTPEQMTHLGWWYLLYTGLALFVLVVMVWLIMKMLKGNSSVPSSGHSSIL